MSTALHKNYLSRMSNLLLFIVPFLSLLLTFMCQKIDKVRRKSNNTCKLLIRTKQSWLDAILQHNKTQNPLPSSFLWLIVQLDDAVLKILTRSAPNLTPQGPLARIAGSYPLNTAWTSTSYWSWALEDSSVLIAFLCHVI